MADLSIDTRFLNLYCDTLKEVRNYTFFNPDSECQDVLFKIKGSCFRHHESFTIEFSPLYTDNYCGSGELISFCHSVLLDREKYNLKDLRCTFEAQHDADNNLYYVIRVWLDLPF